MSQIFVLALHLATVNVAVGGPLLALWLHARAVRRGDDAAAVAGLRLLRLSLWAFYGGIALGVVAAGLWWQAHTRQVERAFHLLPMSRYYYGVAELVFSAACFEVWAWLWYHRRRQALAWFLGFAGATNVVYHFPTLFSILSVFSTRPAPADAPKFLALLSDGEVLSRVAHFVLASLAVAGAMLLRPSQSAAQARNSSSQPDAQARVSSLPATNFKTKGAGIALVATLLQWPVGIVLIMQLPEASRRAVMGDDLRTTLLFALSLGAVIMLMHRLAVAAFGETSPAEVRSALLWLGITIVLMTGVRHFARRPLYAPHVAAKTQAMWVENSRSKISLGGWSVYES